MKKLLNVQNPNVYARHLHAPELHPLISVVHFDELEQGVRTSMNSYSVYGLFIQREFPQNLSYGIRPVKVSDWSVVIRHSSCESERLVGYCRCTRTNRRQGR